MKISEDFRRIARNSLANKWATAVAVGLVASILGTSGTNGPEFKINIDVSNASLSFSFAGQDIFSTGGKLSSGIGAFVAGGFGFIIVAIILLSFMYFILGSVAGVGYAKYNLNLVDKRTAVFENLFDYFSYWKTSSVARLLRTIYVLLWSFLLFIPGIVASLSYAMTDYILAENPALTATSAIAQSKSMMYGNRFRLFCLQFSFVGWDILANLTLGIGHLWLTPYKQAAYAAFYREVSGTEVHSLSTDICY